MKVIFRNPITMNFEVGYIVKKVYTPQGVRFNVLNESGSAFNFLPDSKRHLGERGYIDSDLTFRLAPKIETNLNASTRANYKFPFQSPYTNKALVEEG